MFKIFSFLWSYFKKDDKSFKDKDFNVYALFRRVALTIIFAMLIFTAYRSIELTSKLQKLEKQILNCNIIINKTIKK